MMAKNKGSVNFASAIPDPIHARNTETNEQVRLIALGDIEGSSPSYLAVDREGASEWVPLDDIQIVDPDFLPVQNLGTGRT